LVLLGSEFCFKDREEREVYNLFFIGFLVYGIANLIWFLNSIFFDNFLSENFLNIIFSFQSFTKFWLFYYLIKNEKKSNAQSKFLKLYLLVLMVFLIFDAYLPYYFYDFLFIFDSAITILIGYFLRYKEIFLIDWNYFISGSFLWLLGDIYYSFLNQAGIYFMGNIVDFIYFLGFYLMIVSIVYKNFKFSEIFNNIFENTSSYLYN